MVVGVEREREGALGGGGNDNVGLMFHLKSIELCHVCRRLFNEVIFVTETILTKAPFYTNISTITIQSEVVRKEDGKY